MYNFKSDNINIDASQNIHKNSCLKNVRNVFIVKIVQVIPSRKIGWLTLYKGDGNRIALRLARD